jgi:hypothetical protein
MDVSYLQSKPIFEFSDLELKAFGFEISEIILNHEKNLNMIRVELTRRSLSKVVTSVTNDQLNNILTQNKKTI